MTHSCASALPISVRVALEVAHHEAVIRQTYRDSVGVETWSVGLTNASGHNVERYINNPQPLQKCLEVFIWALERYADDVREVFAGHDLSEAQFAAALSFHWNTGSIRKASWVTRWKAGDVSGARVTFMWYNKPASIIGRRSKECSLFFDGLWSGDGFMTEYTQLTSRRTPVWGSAVKRDVSDAFKAILGASQPAVDHVAPRPPTTPPQRSLCAALASLLAGLFGKDKA